MGKSKKPTHSKREEEQARRVMKVIGVSLLILALALLVGISLLG